MDSFEINKIIAAVLLTALIVIGIGKFTDILFHVKKPEQSAYKVEGLEVATANVAAETDTKTPEVVYLVISERLILMVLLLQFCS